MNNEIDAELLRCLLNLARSEGAYSTARSYGHADEYVAVLAKTLTEAEAFFKDNPDVLKTRPMFPTLAVDISHGAGEMMRHYGANSSAEVAKAIKDLREAGKDKQAEQIERYRDMAAYAISRLSA